MSENRSYTLELTPEAKEDLRKIDKSNASRIVKKLLWLAENAKSVNHDALTGQWTGYFIAGELVITALSMNSITMDVFC